MVWTPAALSGSVLWKPTGNAALCFLELERSGYRAFALFVLGPEIHGAPLSQRPSVCGGTDLSLDSTNTLPTTGSDAIYIRLYALPRVGTRLSIYSAKASSLTTGAKRGDGYGSFDCLPSRYDGELHEL